MLSTRVDLAAIDEAGVVAPAGRFPTVIAGRGLLIKPPNARIRRSCGPMIPPVDRDAGGAPTLLGSTAHDALPGPSLVG